MSPVWLLVGQFVLTLLLLGDAWQTYEAQYERFPPLNETNFILGVHPSAGFILAYFLVCIVGHALISWLFSRWSLDAVYLWQSGWIASEFWQLGDGHARGLGL